MKAWCYKANESMAMSPKRPGLNPLHPPTDTHHSSGLPNNGDFLLQYTLEINFTEMGKRERVWTKFTCSFSS